MPSVIGQTTTCAQRAMRRSKYEADRFRRILLGPDALVLGLLRETAGAAAGVLRRLGLDLRDVRRDLERRLRSRGVPEAEKADAGPLCRASALTQAFLARARLKSAALGTPHLLLGVLHEEGSEAVRMLRDRGLDLDAARRAAEEAAARGADADGGVEAPEAEKSPRAWLAALRDPDAKTRVAAVTSLFQAFVGRSVRLNVGPELEPGLESEAVPYLVEALKDSDASVRGLAAQVLARCGEAARPAVPALVAALRDRSNVRAAAAGALAEVGADNEEARAALRDVLQDPSAHVRVAAAHALWRGTKEAAPLLAVLLPMLSGAEPFAASAAQVLGEMAAEAAPAVPALTGLVQDANEHVRICAIHALQKIGPAAASAVPALVRAMRDPHQLVNLAAAAAVMVVAPSHPEAAASLLEALRDPQAQIRQAAAAALGRCSEATREVVPALRERLGDEAGAVRVQAAWSLWRLGDRAGVLPVLSAALADPAPGVAAHAAHVLGELGPGAAEAVPALRAALTGLHPMLRPAAALALWRLTGAAEETLAVLMQALHDADWQTRFASARCLGLMGPAARPALSALLAARGDEHYVVRHCVLDALPKIDPAIAAEADPAVTVGAAPPPPPAGPDRARREIDDWTEALRLDPEDAQAYRCRGQARRESGDHSGAVADCTEAIRLDPEDERAWYVRGWAHLDAGDFGRAAADFTEALRIRPGDVEAHNSRGIARKRQGDLDGAINDYSEVIRLRPKAAGTFLNRALAHRARRSYAEAVADYEQALRLDPEYAAAHNNLACLRATCPDAAFRHGAAAVRHARRACELSGFGRPLFLHTLAAAHAEAGDFGEAVRWMKEALARPERLTPAQAEEFRGNLRLFEQGKPYRQM